MRKSVLVVLLFLLIPVYSIGEYEAANGTTNATSYGRYSNSFGTFETIQTAGKGGIPFDYGSDGDIDIIAQYRTATCPSGGTCFSVYEYNSLTKTYSWKHLAHIGSSDCWSYMRLADINRRESDDLVVRCGWGWYYNDGWNDGTFGTGFLGSGIDCQHWQIGFGDFNNDGHNDYVCPQTSSLPDNKITVRIGLNTGGGDYPTWSVSQFVINYPNNRDEYVTPGTLDFNHDGCMDLVITQPYNDGAYQPNVWYYKGDCTGSFSADGTGQVGQIYNSATVLVSEYGNKLNGEHGWAHRIDGGSKIGLYVDKGISLGEYVVGSNYPSLVNIIKDNIGQPWLYVSGDNNGGSPYTKRAKLLDRTYTNTVTRTMHSTTETDRFSFSFDEISKKSWKTNPYVRIPYSGEEWEQKVDYPYNVLGAAAATVNGKVYIFGGKETPSSASKNDVYEYNPASNSYTWKNNINGGARSYATASVVGNKIYLIGGMDSSGVGTSRVDIYNPSDNSWSTGTSLPTGRHSHTAAVIDGNIYVVGGISGSNRIKRVDMYNPTLGTWTPKSDFPAVISDHMSAAVGGKMYVVGGYFNDVTGDNWRTYEYNPTLDSWTRKADHPRDITNAGAFELNGRLYIVGGRGWVGGGVTMKNNVEEYNPATDTWRSRSSLPIARGTFALSMVGNRIYIIGGYDSAEYIYYKRTDEYDLSPVAWRVNSVVRTSPSSLTYTEVSSIDQVTDGKYYNDVGGKYILAGVPGDIPLGTTYTITATHRVSPDHSGGTYTTTISNAPRLTGQWYTYDNGSGLSSSGCRYSVTDSTGSTTRVSWRSCPAQPTEGQTTNWAPTFSVETSGLAQGTDNKLHFRIKNTAGYETQFNSIYTIDYDGIAPSTSNNYDGNWKSADVSITLTCSDNYAGCKETKYCVSSDETDCTSFSTYSSAFTVTCSSNTVCKKKVRYYSTDNAGNIESTKSVIVKIDKEKPITTYSISPSSPSGENGWYNSNPTVTLSCSDNTGSGCSTTKYCVSTSNTCSPTSTYTGSFIVSTQGNPVYVRYYSTDIVSNQETTNISNFKLDTTAPNVYNNPFIILINHTSQKVFASGATDSLSGIQIYRYNKTNDGSEADLSSTPYTATGLSENTRYGWQIRLKDNAGNWNTYGTATYKYTNVSGPSSISFSEIKNDSIKIEATTFPNANQGNSGYSFECAQGVTGCTNSGWIQTNVYTDTLLTPNTLYKYKERNRNGDAVTTAYSSVIENYTLASTPGLVISAVDSLNVTFDIQQNSNPGYTNYTLSVNTTDNYYVNATGHIVSANLNNPTWQNYSAWQMKSGFTIKGLSPNQSYTVKLKARNEKLVETSLSWKRIHTLANPVTNLSIEPDVQLTDVPIIPEIDPTSLVPDDDINLEVTPVM